MAGLQDLLARSEAAGGMMREQDAAPPPTEESEVLPDLPAEGDALEAGLSQVESAIEGYDQAIADEIRVHLNAIRELSSKEPQQEQGKMEAQAMENPEQGTPPAEKPEVML